MGPGPAEVLIGPPPTDPGSRRLVLPPRSVDDLDLALADTAQWEPARESRLFPAGTTPPSFDDETTVRLLPAPPRRDAMMMAAVIPTGEEVDDMLSCLEVGDLRGLYTRPGTDGGQD